jgi:hypothetical protein
MKQLRKLTVYVAVSVLVAVMAGGINCGNGNEETIPSNPVDPVILTPADPAIPSPSEPTIPTPADPGVPMLQSALEITRFELRDYGSKIFKAYPFSILVQVTNDGQAASGEYTVGIWKYADPATFLFLCCSVPDHRILIDSYAMSGLAPGETHTIKKEDTILNWTAWYTISAEITPIGWQESNHSRHAESLYIEVW